jgi:hypothetical protein
MKLSKLTLQTGTLEYNTGTLYIFSETGTLFKSVPVWLEIFFYTGPLQTSVPVTYKFFSPVKTYRYTFKQVYR